MPKTSERRIQKRSTIQVLVLCQPLGKKAARPTSPVWEMWARDLGDDGVGLRWSRAWAASRSLLSAGTQSRRASDSTRFDTSSPVNTLRKGQKIQLEGLVYGDEGAVIMEGLVQWVRPAKDGTACDFGIAITSPDHRSFFKALQG